MATTEQIETYEILEQHGFHLEPGDDVEEAVNQLPDSGKRKVRDIRLKYSKNPVDEHVSTLIKASKLSPDTDESKKDEFHAIITKALVDLNQIETISPVLKVVACAKVITIIFDFERNSTEFMDPTTNKDTEGICYSFKGEIRVGAKGFLKADEYFKALGVLAHELTHFAMSLVYDNKCKPFHLDDPASEEEFERILKDCKEKKDEEDIIWIVYEYPDMAQFAELIVRVPHMLAHYKGNPKKIKELKVYFKDLFEFYSNITMIALNREFVLMMARQEVEDLNCELNFSKLLNDDGIFFRSLSLGFDFEDDKRLVIDSNCTFLSIRAIHQTLSRKKYFPSSFIFIKLNHLNDDKVYEKIVKAVGGFAKPWLIVDCEDNNAEELTSVARKLTKRVCFIQSYSQILDNTERHVMIHNWSELTEEKQKKYFETVIRFQGKAVKLKELLCFDSKAFDEISLSSLIKGTIVVGKKVEELNVDHYISRYFETEQEEIVDLSSIIFESYMGECILLSSFPAMGKSTEFFNVSKETKENFPSRWIIHMALNLEKYTKYFEAERKIKEDFKKVSDVIKFFCEKIMKIEGFEAKVFEHCFNEGQVVVLMDGLDEICPDFQRFIENLMNSIRYETKNCLWISTRPHLEQKMKEKLKASVFNLCPFSHDEQFIYLKASLESKHIQQGLIDQKLKQIDGLFESLNKSSDEINLSSSNPLILWMFAEAFDEIDFELENVNFYSFYQKFVGKMISSATQKGEVALREYESSLSTLGDSNEHFYVYAFKSIFHDRKLTKKMTTCFKNIQLPKNHRNRLLTFNSSTLKVNFVHQTFAEYFVASFFYNHLFCKNVSSSKIFDAKNVKQMFKLIWIKDYGNSFAIIKVFLNSALDLTHVATERSSSADLRDLFRKTFNEMELAEFFIDCLRLKLENILSLILNHLVKGSHELYGFMTRNVFYHQNILHKCASLYNFEIVQRLFKLAESKLSVDLLKKFLTSRSDYGMNCLHFAIGNSTNAEVFKYLSDYHLFSEEEKFELLFQIDIDGKNILMFALIGWKEALSESLDVSLVDSFFDIFKGLSSEKNTELFKADQDGQTPVFAAASTSIEIFNRVWEFVQRISSDQWFKAELLMKADNDSCTILHEALKSSNFQLFNRIRELIENICGEQALKNMMLSENSNFENLFHFSFHEEVNKENFREFSIFWSKIF